MVFCIDGIPVLVIECKNAHKDEAIALGMEQIRRYHRETPELFVTQQLFILNPEVGGQMSDVRGQRLPCKDFGEIRASPNRRLSKHA